MGFSDPDLPYWIAQNLIWQDFLETEDHYRRGNDQYMRVPNFRSLIFLKKIVSSYLVPGAMYVIQKGRVKSKNHKQYFNTCPRMP